MTSRALAALKGRITDLPPGVTDADVGYLAGDCLIRGVLAEVLEAAGHPAGASLRALGPIRRVAQLARATEALREAQVGLPVPEADERVRATRALVDGPVGDLLGVVALAIEDTRMSAIERAAYCRFSMLAQDVCALAGAALDGELVSVVVECEAQLEVLRESV